MSKLIFISIITFLLFSCGENNSAPVNKNQNEIQTAISTETDVAVLEDETEAFEPREFKLEDFPKKWVKLLCSPNGDDCVIYHYCEAETPGITIEAGYGDKWVLWALYGQDGESWIINEFSAIEKEMELMRVVEGTMKLVKENDESSVTNVNFMWNKDAVFCNFIGIFQGGENFFVNEEDRGNYEEEHEDCTGLWE